MGNTLITSTSCEGLKIPVIHGTPIYQWYRGACQLLRQKLGGAYAELFAEPVVDAHNNRIDWYSDQPATPIPYTALPPQEQTTLLSKCQERLAEIKKLRETLSATAQGELLQQMLFCPDLQKCLFSLNGEPVIIAWGLQKAQGERVGACLIDRGDIRHAAVASSEAPIVRAPQADPAVAAKKRGLWSPWLWLIPLLLLLLALLWWLLPHLFRPFGLPFSLPKFDLPAIEAPKLPSISETTDLGIKGFKKHFQATEVKFDTGIADNHNNPLQLLVKINPNNTAAEAYCHIPARDVTCEGPALIDSDEKNLWIKIKAMHCSDKTTFSEFFISCKYDEPNCVGLNARKEVWAFKRTMK